MRKRTTGPAKPQKSVGVIGTFINDSIEPYGREPSRSLGGIFYSVSYLANVLEPDWIIVPVSRVGEDVYDEITGRFSRYPNVDLDKLIKEGRNNTQVRLLYNSAGERQEITTEPMLPVEWTDLRRVLRCDIVLMNFITGQEVVLADFLRLSRESCGILYEDYHNLAWGIDKKGRRYARNREDWQEWIGAADIVQMNQIEAVSLLGRRRTTSVADFKELASSVLEMRPTIFIVTLGSDGAFISYKDSGGIHASVVEGTQVEPVIDSTGCGDAFAAGFLRSYSSSKDVYASTRFANFVAGLNCCLLGTEGIDSIADRIALWSDAGIGEV